MAQRGRPRKPKPSIVRATAGRPSCPVWLGREGKAEWRRVTIELDKLGLLSKADRASLVAYCEAWEEFVDLLRKVRKEGPVLYTDKGNAIQNPVLGAKNKAAERVLKCAAQFGLTPAARTKIEAANAGDEDDFSAFVQRRA